MPADVLAIVYFIAVAVQSGGKVMQGALQGVSSTLFSPLLVLTRAS